MCPLLFIGARALGHRAIKDHVNNGSTNNLGRKTK
jgi:hypothetical protein